MKDEIIKYSDPCDTDDSDELNENDKPDEADASNGHKRFSMPKTYAKASRHRISFNLILIVVAIVAIAVAVCAVCFTVASKSTEEPVAEPTPTPADEPSVITIAALQKIVEVSELSTYEVDYTGIAVRYNEKKTETVDYYVLYEATVKAGIEFEEIDFSVDNDSKLVVARLPKVEITEANVEISSLEYMFYNKKLNTDGVTKEAFELCTEDLNSEIEKNETIYNIAEENAKKAVEALISPFIEASDEEYTLEIRTAA